MDRQPLFRWLLKTRPFTRFYGHVIGPASVQLFTPLLDREVLRDLPAGARVLEVGCGPGLQAIEVARRRPDLRIVASDFSQAFVALAQGNARAAGVTVESVVADAMDLSRFEPGTFDAVYSVTAIKHFPDPVRGLTECLRVLRPGGRLWVAEIRRESTLSEVESLIADFQAPPRLRRFAAKFVHGNLREECPPMEVVASWFGSATDLRAIEGRPAWRALVTRGAEPLVDDKLGTSGTRS